MTSNRTLAQWARSVFDSGSVDGRRRNLRIAHGTAAALANKGIAALVSFISVPLTVRYLGPERYGVWMTISTLLAWMSLADFGLGNSLTNAVSEASSKDRKDLAHNYVSSVFWLLTGVSAIGATFLLAFGGRIDWTKLINLSSHQAIAEAAPALAVAASIFLLNFPLTVVPAILAGHQETAAGNYWAAIGNVTALLGLIVATHFKCSLSWLVVAFSGSLLLVSGTSALWLFFIHKPWLAPQFSAITRASLSKLGNVGGMFFVIQVAGLLVLQTDNLVIAHYLGASAVTPYSVTWRLFTCTTLLQSVLVQAIWPAYTEAFARGDSRWIKRTLRMNLLINGLTTGTLVAVLVATGPMIILAWAGPAAVPPFRVVLYMGIWSLISAVLAPLICLLNARGRLKGQMIYGIMLAIANRILSVYLLQRSGIEGVILGTVLAYSIFAVVPLSIECAIVLKELSTSPRRQL